MAMFSSHRNVSHSDEELTQSSATTVFRRLSIVSTSLDCYPFSITGTTSIMTSDIQTDSESSSDSLCGETEAEGDSMSSRAQISKVSKRSIVNSRVVPICPFWLLLIPDIFDHLTSRYQLSRSLQNTDSLKTHNDDSKILFIM